MSWSLRKNASAIYLKMSRFFCLLVHKGGKSINVYLINIPVDTRHRFNVDTTSCDVVCLQGYIAVSR